MIKNEIKTTEDIKKTGVSRAFEDNDNYYVYLDDPDRGEYDNTMYMIEKSTGNVTLTSSIDLMLVLDDATEITVDELYKDI